MTDLKGVAAAAEKSSSLLRAKMQCPTCASVLSLTVIPACLPERYAKTGAGTEEGAARTTAAGGDGLSWLPDVGALAEEEARQRRRERRARRDRKQTRSSPQTRMTSSTNPAIGASDPAEPSPGAARESVTDCPRPSASDPLTAPTEEADAVAHAARTPAPSPVYNQAWPVALARDSRISSSRRHGALSLGLGCVAFALGQMPSLGPLVLSCGGLGALLGIRSLLRVLHLDSGKMLPALGAAVNVGVLLIAGVGLTFSEPAPDSRILLIPGPGQYDGPSGGQLREIGPSEWIDASKNAVQQGNARVRLTHVFASSLSGKDGKSAQTKRLTIAVRIEHKGAKRRFDYRSWAGMGAREGKPAVRLVDDKGKEYAPRARDPNAEMEGQVRSVSLAPRESVSDLLVFELPASRIPFLHLELAAEAIGGAGTLRLEIPRAMIDYRK